MTPTPQKHIGFHQDPDGNLYMRNRSRYGAATMFPWVAFLEKPRSKGAYRPATLADLYAIVGMSRGDFFELNPVPMVGQQSRGFYVDFEKRGLVCVGVGVVKEVNRDVCVEATPTPTQKPLVISGPSGVGKGMLLARLFEPHSNTFAFSVSHTTRPARAGEIDGSRAHSVKYTSFSGNWYVTSKVAIEEQMSKGLIVVLDIEMEGVKQIRSTPEIGENARYIWLNPEF
ncbi:guanylate kinase [Aspergillus stella-maris]|uniref:guanylate kinase n=1 Tax=Aspergillus stella-maris TaxID=1810926 RepID=UPI003CCD1DC5